jgi:hypothetical protein
MNYSAIVSNGFARDEALKRRNGAVREVLGLGPKPNPTPTPDPEQPAEQKAEEKDGGRGRLV